MVKFVFFTCFAFFSVAAAPGAYTNTGSQVPLKARGVQVWPTGDGGAAQKKKKKKRQTDS